MKALVTGLHGTVAPVLAKVLSDSGHRIIPWDRSVISIDNGDTMRAFVVRERPDWFFHLATGSPDWAERVARVCAEEEIKFLFTSSVSVFSAAQRGPFTVNDLPEPDHDYGRYKLDCERRIRKANPESHIVRLGWQIGESQGANHMVEYLERTFRTQGRIDASIHWYQACSFLPDTAVGLAHIMQRFPAGLYHLDGNPGLNFFEVVAGLNKLHNEPWRVEPADLPDQNNRLLDPRVPVNLITNRIEGLTTHPSSFPAG